MAVSVSDRISAGELEDNVTSFKLELCHAVASSSFIIVNSP